MLRENHSGMETEEGSDQPACCFALLRENHSGMETFLADLGFFYVFFTRCVRTIVVWKQQSKRGKSLKQKELRENHSGMETVISSSVALNFTFVA